ncbi:hypothetical protein ACYOEI_02435 [Singulisphaera rosea]
MLPEPEDENPAAKIAFDPVEGCAVDNATARIIDIKLEVYLRLGIDVSEPFRMAGRDYPERAFRRRLGDVGDIRV